MKKYRIDRRDECQRLHGPANYIRKPGSPPRCRVCHSLRARAKRLELHPPRTRPEPVEWMTSYQTRVYLSRPFWGRIQFVDPGDWDACWAWTAGRSEDGYGRLKVKGQAWYAHRLARHLAFGDLPEAACHQCDWPPCVNPEHLRSGTLSDNTAEMWAKGRANVITKVPPDRALSIAAQVAAIRQSGRGRRARLELLARANDLSVRTLYRLISEKEMPRYLAAKRQERIAA